MNEIEWLKSMDRGDAAPALVDVTASVMRAVRSRSRTSGSDRVFPIAAAVAAAVGLAAATIVAPVWFAPADPFTGFGEVINLVLR